MAVDQEVAGWPQEAAPGHQQEDWTPHKAEEQGAEVLAVELGQAQGQAKETAPGQEQTLRTDQASHHQREEVRRLGLEPRRRVIRIRGDHEEWKEEI